MPANPSLTANHLKSKDKILISLVKDVNIDSKIAGVSHLVDFSDAKYDGKTIIIDGNNRTIKISTPDVFFLRVSGCRVILKNITIDGANQSREGAFVWVSGANSALEIGKGATIQNCKNQGKPGKDGINGKKGATGSIKKEEIKWQHFIIGYEYQYYSGSSGSDGSDGENGKDALGGAIYCNGATVKLSPGAVIKNCSVIGGDGGNGGNGGQGGDGAKGYDGEDGNHTKYKGYDGSAGSNGGTGGTGENGGTDAFDKGKKKIKDTKKHGNATGAMEARAATVATVAPYMSKQVE